jgi:hypothetical protein
VLSFPTAPDCIDRKASYVRRKILTYRERALTPIEDFMASAEYRANSDIEFWQALKRRKDDEAKERNVVARQLAELDTSLQHYKGQLRELLEDKTKEELLEWLLGSSVHDEYGEGEYEDGL